MTAILALNLNQTHKTMIIYFVVLIYVVIIALIIAARWKVFTKAGQPGWASIIPIYNTYIMTKIGGKPGWWVLMMFIPIVNLVYLIWLYNMISKSFGKDEGFTVGMIFLGIVFWPILAFGSAQYIGPYGDPEAYNAATNPELDFNGK